MYSGRAVLLFTDRLASRRLPESPVDGKGCRMKTLLLVAALTVGVFAAGSRADAPEPYIADSPQQIRPLLIGAEIPDVTLVTPDYHPVLLRGTLAQQSTILIYYRGGW